MELIFEVNIIHPEEKVKVK